MDKLVGVEVYCNNCGKEFSYEDEHDAHEANALYECPKCHSRSLIRDNFIKCDCGRTVYLQDPLTNECTCGRFYNRFGQELSNPSEWDSEDRYDCFGPQGYADEGVNKNCTNSKLATHGVQQKAGTGAINKLLFANEEMTLGGVNSGVSYDKVMELADELGIKTLVELNNFYDNNKQGNETLFDTLLRHCQYKQQSGDAHINSGLQLGGELEYYAKQLNLYNLRQVMRFYKENKLPNENSVVDTLRRFVAQQEVASTKATESAAKKISFKRKSSSRATESEESTLSIEAQEFLAKHYELTEKITRFEKQFNVQGSLLKSESLMRFVHDNKGEVSGFPNQVTVYHGGDNGEECLGETEVNFISITSLSYDLQRGKLLLFAEVDVYGFVYYSYGEPNYNRWYESGQKYDEGSAQIVGHGSMEVTIPSDPLNLDMYEFSEISIDDYEVN